MADEACRGRHLRLVPLGLVLLCLGTAMGTTATAERSLCPVVIDSAGVRVGVLVSVDADLRSGLVTHQVEDGRAVSMVVSRSGVIRGAGPGDGQSLLYQSSDCTGTAYMHAGTELAIFQERLMRATTVVDCVLYAEQGSVSEIPRRMVFHSYRDEDGADRSCRSATLEVLAVPVEPVLDLSRFSPPFATVLRPCAPP